MAIQFFFERLNPKKGEKSSFAYSNAFRELTKKPSEARRLFEGSEIHFQKFDTDSALLAWERGRKPIAEIIDSLFEPREQPIRVLDFGSANGFLLRSLKEWSGRTLEPYGYDTNSRAVRSARRLFPGEERHFASSTKEAAEFPSRFEVVYWNIWDNWTFSGLDAKPQVARFEELLKKAGPDGFLIVGFYDETREAQEAKLRALEKAGHTPLGRRVSEGSNESFAWFSGR